MILPPLPLRYASHATPYVSCFMAYAAALLRDVVC